MKSVTTDQIKRACQNYWGRSGRSGPPAPPGPCYGIAVSLLSLNKLLPAAIAFRICLKQTFLRTRFFMRWLFRYEGNKNFPLNETYSPLIEFISIGSWSQFSQAAFFFLENPKTDLWFQIIWILHDQKRRKIRKLRIIYHDNGMSSCSSLWGK